MKSVSLILSAVLILVGFLVSASMPAQATSQPIQADSNPYADADILLSSVLDHLQYPIPQTVTMSQPGNHLNFSAAKANTANPTADEVRYVAAFRFCEHLVPVFPSPTYKSSGQSMTIADYQSIYADRNESALKSAAMETCFAALAYRTSCPAASASNFTLLGQSANCFTLQQKMCHYLKDAAPNGLGIDGIGDQDADYALKNCDTDGLSPAMYDMIFAHRCDNAAYVQNLGTVLDGAAEVERMLQFECPVSRDAFDAKLDREKERILIATQTLVQLRTIGGSAGISATAQPTGSGSSGPTQ